MVTLKINGRNVDVEDETMPLLWAIRDIAGLTGTKYGCGIQQCGACTVHVDGSAVRSCGVTVAAAEGAEIVTIEGLSEDGNHPLQQAWCEQNVPQCGYCQAGQIMNAASLLKDKSAPTDAEIDRAMTGNICRCGTYKRIRAAIHRAVELGEEG